jgi:hypothetical protein
MKRNLVLWLVLAICTLSAFSAMAGGGSEEMVTVRRSILVTGEFQRYMPYGFTASYVNCGTLETSQMTISQPFFGVVGAWEKKNPGEAVSSGWYRFNVTGADLSKCAPIIDVTSEVPVWFANMYIGSFMEIEPEDLGLLVKGGNVPSNKFNLSTDDRAFSYELVAMAPGTERELVSFIHNTHFFSDTGDKKIVGAIVADSRGFLKRKVAFNVNPLPERTIQVPVYDRRNKNKIVAYRNFIIPAENYISPQDNIIVREGDVLVLIRKES